MVLDPTPASGWKPALETKTALKVTALIRRLFLTVARLPDSTTGRRRSALLTRGGLIGVRRSHAHLRITALNKVRSLLAQTCQGQVSDPA